jgi:Fic family protein
MRSPSALSTPAYWWVDVLRRVALEFVQMPELMVTVKQGARLWALPDATCHRALHELADIGFLVRVDDRSDLREPRFQRARRC